MDHKQGNGSIIIWYTVNFAEVDFAQVELSPISNIFDSPNLLCAFSMVCFSHKSKL